jgi:hypothetical protein
MAAGALLLSIDLELDIQTSDPLAEERLDDVRTRLIAETAALGIPATWAVADPVRSAATESILAGGIGHELAVLADRSWVGPGCGRTRLDRELGRRFDAARRSGIPVSTLALRNAPTAVDVDLLLDHGITAIRGPAAATASLARKVGMPPIRFGIWQAPAAWRIPTESRWWFPRSWPVRRELRRAILRGSLLHLDIDAAGLVGQGQGLAAVQMVLRLIAAEMAAGRLQVETIAAVAQRELRQRDSVPSRSILRGAA